MNRRQLVTGTAASAALVGGCAGWAGRGKGRFRPAVSPSVDSAFPGGNIVVDRVVGDELYVHQDLRDTRSDWFWWYFRVRGAQGRQLTVHFTRSNVIGVRGPAISLDGGASWTWSGAKQTSGASFRFACPPDAAEVRFCFAMPYLQADLHRFIARHVGNPHLRVDTLCMSRKGRAVERLSLGRLDGHAPHRVALTARHHACETMASWSLEGLLEEALADSDDGAWLRAHAEICAVPFVDKDGVEDGDQGKLRRPRDHNRDYEGESLYPEVRAIRERIPRWSEGKLRLGLDMHCPWIRNGDSETIYFVGSKDEDNWRRVLRLSALVEQAQRGPLRFRSADNMPYGTKWNTDKNVSEGKPFGTWVRELPGVTGSTIEIPYANAHDIPVTADSARAFGHDLARAIRRFLQESPT